MILGWFKQRRRRRIVAQPFPNAWEQVIRQNFHHDHYLSESERVKLRRNIQILVAEKNWEGCGGQQMTEEVRVTIAAHACLLVLGMDDEHFDMVQTILVYPTSYVAPDQTVIHPGLVLEGRSHREGEAWYRGPVIISWEDALDAGRGTAAGHHNLVLHEFAHQLDMQNGREADGIPPLANRVQLQRWQEVMTREYQRLVEDCDYGRPTLVDCYGGTCLAEFFATATESFFEQPLALSDGHPELYALLRDYYRQDPAERMQVRQLRK